MEKVLLEFTAVSSQEFFEFDSGKKQYNLFRRQFRRQNVQARTKSAYQLDVWALYPRASLV